MNGLQSLGRALMLPIAVLPIAGLLLRVGQPDLLDIAFLTAAGDAIFSHLGLLFAIGVATGYARDGNGAACLAGVVCFLVARSGAEALMHVPADVAAGYQGPAADALASMWKDKAIARIEVPVGILSGLAGGLLYNRVVDIRLPGYLAFFSGRRLVPIVCGLVGLVIAAFIGWGFDAIAAGVDGLSRGISSSGSVGLFFYGLLNRLFLVTGLHHILNNIAWFVVGDYHGATGDLRRFFAGDPAAGGFMSGFFPVMIFGLPAACLAMYRSARPDRRKETGGMLLSLALTAALTGVTEPIEFTFMFVAPLLYAIHAVLTGVAMALMDLLGCRLGFTFSAGLFDYVLNFGKSSRPWMLLPVGIAYAVIYYAVFRFAIIRFDIATPGREQIEDADPGKEGERKATGSRGEDFVAALGGISNLTSIGACTTRLRLILVDPAKVDEGRLKELGAIAILRPSPTGMQVILGPVADQVAMEMRDASMQADVLAHTETYQPTSQPGELALTITEALGGASNIIHCDVFWRRLRVQVKDADRIDETGLTQAGMRHLDRGEQYLHILFSEPFEPSISLMGA
ncbi:PTS N-acetyl-D-glucosamine transporter [Sphingomonas koreensis]|nr:PTS N-acetyl-D-glucosamine transporter [Sphingomonas koreensis]